MSGNDRTIPDELSHEKINQLLLELEELCRKLGSETALQRNGTSGQSGFKSDSSRRRSRLKASARRGWFRLKATTGPSYFQLKDESRRGRSRLKAGARHRYFRLKDESRRGRSRSEACNRSRFFLLRDGVRRRCSWVRNEARRILFRLKAESERRRSQLKAETGRRRSPLKADTGRRHFQLKVYTGPRRSPLKVYTGRRRSPLKMYTGRSLFQLKADTRRRHFRLKADRERRHFQLKAYTGRRHFQLKVDARHRHRRRNIRIAVLWFVTLCCIFKFLVGITVLSGSSMRPALYSGDILIYQRLGINKVKRGDILIIGNADKEGRSLAKRVTAISGDRISVDENGHVTLNGNTLKEPEVLYGYQPPDHWMDFPVTVGPGEFFFLGDNRAISLDSRDRDVGMGSLEQVQGKVLAVIRTGNR